MRKRQKFFPNFLKMRIFSVFFLKFSYDFCQYVYDEAKEDIYMYQGIVYHNKTLKCLILRKMGEIFAEFDKY